MSRSLLIVIHICATWASELNWRNVSPHMYNVQHQCNGCYGGGASEYIRIHTWGHQDCTQHSVLLLRKHAMYQPLQCTVKHQGMCPNTSNNSGFHLRILRHSELFSVRISASWEFTIFTVILQLHHSLICSVSDVGRSQSWHDNGFILDNNYITLIWAMTRTESVRG